MKYYNTLPEEQETNIIVDYYNRNLCIYVSRKSILERLYKKLGKAEREYYINGKLSGARWIIPFSKKKEIGIALSRPLLIGQMKNI